MKGLSCCLAVAAMLLALVSAPLVHIHDRDDHGNPGFVHAHFPELEHHQSSAGPEIEPEHPSHQQARSVDVFTLNTPVLTVLHAVAELSELLSAPPPHESRAVVGIETQRAHSPPDSFGIAPRSPPAI